MLAIPRFSEATDVQRPKAKLGTKARKRQRQMALESLESRVVLSYTFSYVGNVATALGSGGTVDSLVIEPFGGFLLHSVNGSPFDGDWGGVSVPAESAAQRRCHPLHRRRLVDPGSARRPVPPAISASPRSTSWHHRATPPTRPSSTTATAPPSPADPSVSHRHQARAYQSGPGFNYYEFHRLSLCRRDHPPGLARQRQPLQRVVGVDRRAGDVETAAGTTSTVNVGSAGGTLGNIFDTVAIYDPGDATTININDAADTTTLDRHAR